ncbi:hypothetical protein KZX45_08185 [Georgenia sp. EYE_87]|uniref:hypothetical protein n=1 Tax=Georgenia sp. EYE_87 TaxID=2853448 RepID=UPI002005CA04|nr:hypothetical protein [Georgenia sp. EYE_87]MCK6210519.1 hypothetical protein [Georgenia sp. EYE_87]
MDALMTSSAGTVALALVTAWVGYLLGGKQEREKEKRSRNVLAAGELTEPLRELQRLLRRLGRDDVDKAEVVSAFIDWSSAYDNHAHRLPAKWRHLSRSIRDAAGTVFGGVSLVHIRPNLAHLELGEPDGMWQDYADEYLEYAASCLLKWGDSSKSAPTDLMTYEAWLVSTGRREPYGHNRHEPDV